MSTSHRSRLRRRFEDELLRDVRLHLRVHAGACVPCCLTKELIEEIASLSPRLSSKIVTDGGAVPEIRLDGNARGQIGFTGLPSGYELPAFIDSILDVSRGTTSLTEVARKRLSRLRKPVRIQVFTTPT